MPLMIEAVFEDGVLKPIDRLALPEHQRVRVMVQPIDQAEALQHDEADRIVRRSYGLIGWTGDLETLRRIAEDPEFGLLESP